MMRLNLQFFGGRGSAGGKNLKGAEVTEKEKKVSTKSRKQIVEEAQAKRNPKEAAKEEKRRQDVAKMRANVTKKFGDTLTKMSKLAPGSEVTVTYKDGTKDRFVLQASKSKTLAKEGVSSDMLRSWENATTKNVTYNDSKHIARFDGAKDGVSRNVNTIGIQGNVKSIAITKEVKPTRKKRG